MLTLLALVVDTLKQRETMTGHPVRDIPGGYDLWFWPAVTDRATGRVSQWAATSPAACGLVTP